MYNYYRIAELTIQSRFMIESFKGFSCTPAKADVIIEETRDPAPDCPVNYAGNLSYRQLPEGWFFSSYRYQDKGVYVTKDYSQIRVTGAECDPLADDFEWLIRVALECWLSLHGFISLHAAAVEVDGKAYAFSGHSGLGKSTRARSWIEAFCANLISGDRPLINVNATEVYGVPWDGKERCFRDVHYPLGAIFDLRRSNTVFIRKMSTKQKKALLLRQCFMPMFDTELAIIQMVNISKLAKNAVMVRACCGPDAKDARALYDALLDHRYLEEDRDMKARTDFVLRTVVDEYILMPTGNTIGKFKGTVLLNEVSAFVWEKLQNPMSKEDLLKAILEEYEVDKATASADLDALLETLRGYGVIEDE